MSDGINFTILPLWENMNFNRSCTLYGNWLSAFLKDYISLQTNITLGSSAGPLLSYFESALPEDYIFPGNGTLGAFYGTILELVWVERAVSKAGLESVGRSGLLTSMRDSYYANPNDTIDTGFFTFQGKFYEYAYIGPRVVCRPEYCMALGYTGNMDLTGIGVRLALVYQSSGSNSRQEYAFICG